MADPFNLHRVYQAMKFLPYLEADKVAGVKEDGTPKSCATEHRVLLVGLAWRMADTTNLKTQTIKDTAFPSLDTLATDTGFSERTIRYALDRLIAHGWLRKTYKEGHTHCGRPSKETQGTDEKVGTYKNCRYHVTPKWDQVEGRFDPEKKKAAKQEPVTTPVPAPKKATPEENAEVDAIVASGPQQVGEASIERVSDERRQAFDKVFDYFKRDFADHPTMMSPNARTMMRGAIDSCLDLAKGEADLVVGLVGLLKDDKATALRGSKNLGGYLKKSFPGWLGDWVSGEAVTGSIDRACFCDDLRGFAMMESDPDRCARLAHVFELILRHRLGDDLMSHEQYEDENNDLCVTFVVSNAFAEEWRRTHANPVNPKDSRDEDTERGSSNAYDDVPEFDYDAYFAERERKALARHEERLAYR